MAPPSMSPVRPWQVLDSSSFRVSVVEDPEGVEMCGAVKNVVALGAGFCDGLGYG